VPLVVSFEFFCISYAYNVFTLFFSNFFSTVKWTVIGATTGMNGTATGMNGTIAIESTPADIVVPSVNSEGELSFSYNRDAVDTDPPPTEAGVIIKVLPEAIKEIYVSMGEVASVSGLTSLTELEVSTFAAVMVNLPSEAALLDVEVSSNGKATIITNGTNVAANVETFSTLKVKGNVFSGFVGTNSKLIVEGSVEAVEASTLGKVITLSCDGVDGSYGGSCEVDENVKVDIIQEDTKTLKGDSSVCLKSSSQRKFWINLFVSIASVTAMCFFVFDSI